jgi:hypothetical protein
MFVQLSQIVIVVPGKLLQQGLKRSAHYYCRAAWQYSIYCRICNRSTHFNCCRELLTPVAPLADAIWRASLEQLGGDCSLYEIACHNNKADALVV